MPTKRALLDALRSATGGDDGGQMDTAAYLRSVHAAVVSAGAGGSDLDVQAVFHDDGDDAELLFKSTVGGLKIILGRLKLTRVPASELAGERAQLVTRWLDNEQLVQVRCCRYASSRMPLIITHENIMHV